MSLCIIEELKSILWTKQQVFRGYVIFSWYEKWFFANFISLICNQSIHGVNHANRIIIKYDKSSFDDAIKCFFPYYHNPSSTGS